MFTLLNELHFWTFKSEIAIRDTDFGSFKYFEKRSQLDYDFLLGKKSYSEQRGITWSPSNKKPLRLKDSLKELEDYLDTVRVVCVQWRESTRLQVVLSSGTIANIRVNPSTGDVHQIQFDKHLCGKLLSDYVSDVAVCKEYAVFTYGDNQVTLVDYSRDGSKGGGGSSGGGGGTLRKWAGVDDVKCRLVELAGPTGRRLGRRLSFNSTNDKLLVWWKSSRDEVYPWSPTVKDQDRANVHVYQINGLKLELLCYYRTESDPVLVTFSCRQPNVIHSIQQKISNKGEVHLSWCQFEVSKGSLMRGPPERALSLSNHISALALSPTEDKIIVGCIDGTVSIADSKYNIVLSSKASFIPSIIGWHPDSCLIVIANERGQLQFYDLTLACVRAQLISEDIIPSNIIDVGAYFKHQPTLLNMYWSKKPELANSTLLLDGFLLLHFERGPLAVVRLVGGCVPGFSVDSVVSHYLSANMVDRAVNLLATLSWDLHGNVALASLQSIVRHLVSKPLTPDRESLIEKALACYHAPKRSFSQSTDLEFCDSVHDLTRKVFHHFLRYQVVDKSFRLAIDIGDYDLFMDLHNYCKSVGLNEMADAALEKAEEISEYSSSRSGSSLSHCSSSGSSSSESSRSSYSDSSCSECSRETAQVEDTAPPPLPQRHKVKFSNMVTRITLPSLEEDCQRVEPIYSLPKDDSIPNGGIGGAIKEANYNSVSSGLIKEGNYNSVGSVGGIIKEGNYNSVSGGGIIKESNYSSVSGGGIIKERNYNSVGGGVIKEGNYNTVGLPDPSENGLNYNYQIDPGGPTVNRPPRPPLPPPPYYNDNNGNRGEEGTKIKVVHFGLV